MAFWDLEDEARRRAEELSGRARQFDDQFKRIAAQTASISSGDGTNGTRQQPIRAC
jgi:hypothetical protein